jgi:hypothetical protein
MNPDKPLPVVLSTIARYLLGLCWELRTLCRVTLCPTRADQCYAELIAAKQRLGL